MTFGQVSNLISAVAQLVGVLIWPTVLLFLLVRFRGPIANFLSDLGEFSVKAAGVEASAKRQQEAGVALGAAVAARAPGESGLEADLRDVAAVIPGPRVQRRLHGAQVLWVDDRPGNNRFEQRALEALGIDVESSTSTEGAIDKLRRRPYDLVISDMSRPPDPRAGYTLLDRLREIGNRVPYVIYSSSKTQEYVDEARVHGAIGYTDLPQELITMVSVALTARR